MAAGSEAPDSGSGQDGPMEPLVAVSTGKANSTLNCRVSPRLSHHVCLSQNKFMLFKRSSGLRGVGHFYRFFLRTLKDVKNDHSV